MKAGRRKFSAVFKAQVTLEAIKERETLAELSKRFEVHAFSVAPNRYLLSIKTEPTSVF